MKKKIQIPIWGIVVLFAASALLLLSSFGSKQDDGPTFSEWEKALMRDAYEIGYINAWTEINDQTPGSVSLKTKSWLRKSYREFGGTIVYNFIDKDPKCKELKF